ncbi:MAG: hypothetical protein ACRCZF_02805, partial [Gemmataceae bacterium]
MVYLAGMGSTGGSVQPATGSIRIDTTIARDAQNFVFFNNNDNVGGAATEQVLTKGGAIAVGGDPQLRGSGPNRGLLFQPTPSNATYFSDFYNLSRDPLNPFIQNSTLRTYNFVTNFSNNGFDVSWSPFSEILSNGQGGANDVHNITTYYDPLTGRTRLIYATDHGVFTGVDDGQGNIIDSIGFSDSTRFSRNGNLQLSQFYAGAVQPSQFAADIAGALFYGNSKSNGFPVSAKDVFSTGNLNWTGPLTKTNSAGVPVPDPNGILYNFDPTGTGVVVDPTGSGTAYQYRQPCCGGDFGLPTDFFRVLLPGTNPSGSGTSRTLGLTTTGDNPGLDQGQWRTEDPTLGFFAVNPINNKGMAIASGIGRVYRTTNQGVNWFPIAEPADLDGSSSRAIAYGAPSPLRPNLLDDFIYVGTYAGGMFVTDVGDGRGGNWRDISAGLDGNPVMQIVTNPDRGTRDAFAVTTKGIFYTPEAGRSATPTSPAVAAQPWINITGNIFNLRKSIFSDPNQTPFSTDDLPRALRSLTSIQVDWRYDQIINGLDPTLNESMIYVAGDGGVFRSKDFGTTWTFFPNVVEDGAPVNGGYLPNAYITDLDLSIGAIDPNTGSPVSSGGNLNMLVASTFGRGMFAIRLDTNLPATSFQSGPAVSKLMNPNVPVTGPSSSLKLQFNGAVDPATFTPADVVLLDVNGNPVTITGIIPAPVPVGTPDPHTDYTITFNPQTPEGFYKLVVGPNLSDYAGFKMNQNMNLANGEIDDSYVSFVYLNGLGQSLIAENVPQFVTAGDPVSFTLRAVDVNGNTLVGINQDVAITISDPNESFP